LNSRSLRYIPVSAGENAQGAEEEEQRLDEVQQSASCVFDHFVTATLDEVTAVAAQSRVVAVAAPAVLIGSRGHDSAANNVPVKSIDKSHVETVQLGSTAAASASAAVSEAAPEDAGVSAQRAAECAADTIEDKVALVAEPLCVAVEEVTLKVASFRPGAVAETESTTAAATVAVPRSGDSNNLRPPLAGIHKNGDRGELGEGQQLQQQQRDHEQREQTEKVALQYLSLSRAYITQHKLALALKQCNMAVKKAPHLIEPLQLRGDLYTVLGETKKAVDDYIRILVELEDCSASAAAALLHALSKSESELESSTAALLLIEYASNTIVLSSDSNIAFIAKLLDVMDEIQPPLVLAQVQQSALPAADAVSVLGRKGLPKLLRLRMDELIAQLTGVQELPAATFASEGEVIRDEDKDGDEDAPSAHAASLPTGSDGSSSANSASGTSDSVGGSGSHSLTYPRRRWLSQHR
jgi:tetratricopeptide (TPR) repeat protein